MNLHRCLLCLLPLLVFAAAANAQNTGLIGLGGTVACEGDSIRAFSLNKDSLWWTVNQQVPVFAPHLNMTHPGHTRIYARTKTPTQLGPELLANPGFGLGDTGFYTEQIYEENPQENKFSQQYSLVKYIYPEPPVTGMARNMRAEDSLMLFVRKSYGVVWRQDIEVLAGQEYRFAFWYSRLGMGARLRFHVRINGVKLADTSLHTPFTQWKEYAVNWVAGHQDSVVSVEIYAPGVLCFFGGFGYDCTHTVVFDDFSFRMYGDEAAGDLIRYDSAKVNWVTLPFKDADFWEEDSLTCLEDLPELSLPSGFSFPQWQDGNGGYKRFAHQNGWYRARAKNMDLCTVEDSVFIRFNPFKGDELNRSGDSLFAEEGAARYTWWRNDTLLPDTSRGLRLFKEGHYRVEMRDSMNCGRVLEQWVMALGLTLTSGQVGFELYPNPARQAVFLRLNPESTKPTRIEIFAWDGKQVMQLEGRPEDFGDVICLPELLPGIYRVQVVQDGVAGTKSLQILR